MKCLILGSKGMLGNELSSVFRDLNPVLWDKDELDITDEKRVRNKIIELKPELIINAAAYTLVDKAEEEKELANLVNGKAVENLASLAKKLKAILIHYSTDYVFDGQKKAGYQEDDKPSPINAYGRSKLIGEEAVKKICQRYYLIRTSWLYGQAGKNFVKTMMELGKVKNEVKVVADQFSKPTYAVDLAKKTKELVESKKEFGIYHITNEGVTSWYEFAKEIFTQTQIRTKLISISSVDYPTPAKRPHFSSLINTKLISFRNWREALKDYLKQLKA